MQSFSQQLNFTKNANILPKGFSDEIYDLSRSINCAQTAKKVYEKLQPVLKTYRADQTLAIACGLLLEKQRTYHGMRTLWDSLQVLYPDDLTALRMLMRWYRRDQKTEAGIAHIHRLFPSSGISLSQASKAIVGLAELKAWHEIDKIMATALVLHSHDRSIRMAYIKILSEQSRFRDAARTAELVEDSDRMGEASQELLSTVSRNADILRKYGRAEAADIIDDIFDWAFPARKLTSTDRVVFFTGQLGTGGAERQMTRIACAYQKLHDEGHELGRAPEVWVKHATKASGADFYLPLLHDSGVTTRILTDVAGMPVVDLVGLSDELKELIGLLAPDVRRHTCMLYSMFQEHQTDVAYLWQDGGIVQSAIAAVLAGVPRIVTSFRGLPPNLRPNFYRDELPVLYKALARLPNVTFTANSQKTASAYEEWLSLDVGEVIVIPNAIPTVLSDGDETDQALWSEIMAASEPCSNTVLGVFRFDANKRPLQWIEAAARYLKKHGDTRFVMLGDGCLHNDCKLLIEKLGLSNRIFLGGIRNNVGFYMHRADLLMHLAQMEGLPNVLIEAQLAGTPVLATPAGGTSEVVNEGVTGVILSSADELHEQELDEKLESLLADQDERARLGSAAMVHSGERFSVETILGRTLGLFNSTMRDT